MAMISETNRIINSTTTKPITDVTKLDPNKTYDITADGYVERKDPLKEKWYTSTEAAKEVGVTRTDIRNAIYGGHLLATKIPDSSRYGFHYLIKESDLIDWLDDKTKVRDSKRLAARRKDANERYARLRRTTQDNIPVDENGEAYLSTREFAAEIGMSIATVNKYTLEGKLQFVDGSKNGVKGHYIPRSELNKIDEIRSWSKPGPKAKNEEPKMVDIPRPDVVVETNVNLADVMEMEGKARMNPIRLESMFEQIKQMIDDAYEKGVVDGKLSVEFDKSDEYRRGVEEGKKQAKDELLAMLKGV